MTIRSWLANQSIRSLLTRSTGTRALDSPDGSLEVQRPVATHEGRNVLCQDEAFLVDRRLSQEGGEETKGRAQLGFQRVAGCFPREIAAAQHSLRARADHLELDKPRLRRERDGV